MAGLSFELLLRVDPEPWHRAAADWDRLGGSVDERADALVRSRRRLPAVWESGPASAAAGARCDGLCGELDAAFPPVLLIAQALAQHGNTVAELRGRARQLVEQGRAAQVTVHPDGSMTVEEAHATDATARALSALVSARDALLREAAELDARTARVIAENTATTSGTPAARVDGSSVPARGTPPAEVKRWWDSLTPAQRRYAVSEHPHLVGALDGVPVARRDVANRIVLDRELDGRTERRAELDAREAHIRAMLEQGRAAELYPNGNHPGTLLGQRELREIAEERGRIDDTLRGLRPIDDRLADPDKPRAYLIGLSTADDGRAIVSVGNPDAADNVLTYVPGVGAELAGVETGIERADRMALDARRVDPGQETASLYWLGYDAPDDAVVDARSNSYAEAGARELQRFQDGLRVSHEGEQSRNVVLGHSYGSLVIGHAGSGAGIDADAVVFVGAPGVDVDSAPELRGVPAHEVWATRARHDEIAEWSPDFVHGVDPTEPGFGGRVFGSDPGNPDDWVATHSAYWDPGNLARENIAYIVTGQNDKVR
ncbi:alpha/beta hydrolase [Micromonospora sp. WMMD1102]|uniref:alpha/beta hydrolase n=1 Tax=Micromonospora sp. WMMD1102 TaxID=3016105 RepID=UPI0024159558|nr:alpha/beta hydrolase [Micromonospora sp. WMMD1102]MDG4785674.1 alpha/beta hydrolase [Micromonospora sp. WMMD1102]